MNHKNIFSVFVIVLSAKLKSVLALEISCGTRGAAIDFVFPDADLRELNCVCKDDYVGTFGYEKLSEIFNPYIRAFAISNKPRDQRISHIVLRNCKDLKLELDLDRIYREAAAITDLSFQSVNSLDLKFRDISGRSFNMVFEDITTTDFSGYISNRDLTMRMFFRKPRSRRSSVTFNNVNFEANFDVLNLQNVAHLIVANSHFRNINNLEIIEREQNTQCHDRVDNSFYTTDVECSKDLFLVGDYQSSTVDPTNAALTNSVTSRPEFIVPVVLLVLVVVIGVVVGGVYYKYHKSEKQFRMERM